MDCKPDRREQATMTATGARLQSRKRSVPYSKSLPDGAIEVSTEQKTELVSRAVEKYWQQLAKQPSRKAQLRRDLYQELRGICGAKEFEGMRHSFENMRQRGRNGYADVDSRFNEFADFLWHMGPCPKGKRSIDRVDNEFGYSPENCRWASPTEQSRNRRNTEFLPYKGETLPLTEVAELSGQSASTLRARKAKGWTDEEVVEGRSDDGYPRAPADAPWPPKNRNKWEYVFQLAGGGSTYDRWLYLRWRMKEMKRALFRAPRPDGVVYSPETEEEIARWREKVEWVEHYYQLAETTLRKPRWILEARRRWKSGIESESDTWR